MRGDLTAEQAELVKRGGMLWGCDRCQLACPENRHITAAPLPEFAPLPDPTEEELQLSDRVFRRQFSGKPQLFYCIENGCFVEPCRVNGQR